MTATTTTTCGRLYGPETDAGPQTYMRSQQMYDYTGLLHLRLYHQSFRQLFSLAKVPHCREHPAISFPCNDGTPNTGADNSLGNERHRELAEAEGPGVRSCKGRPPEPSEETNVSCVDFHSQLTFQGQPLPAQPCGRYQEGAHC